MSNFYKLTKNPKSGKWENAEWLDNYFNPHEYGVRFPDGNVYNPLEVELEVKEAPVSKTKPSKISQTTTKADQLDTEIRLAFNECLHRMYNLEILPHIQSLINERIPNEHTLVAYHIPNDLETALIHWSERLVQEARIEEVKLLHKDVHAFDYVFNDRIKHLEQPIGGSDE